ncbi:MAG: hypothetical protein ACXVCV_13785, partial [Polyangia bacterium]
KPQRGAINEEVDLPFAIFSVASVWLNPVAWEHYNVTLLFPLALAGFAVWRRGRPRRLADAGWTAAVTALLLFVAWLLSIDMYEKNHAATEAATRWYVTANWLPWPITLAVLGALLWRQRRISAAAAAPPA